MSTKGRYGLRAMVDLAIYSNTEHVALSCIAERQGVSANYLEQVFSILRKDGLVKSVKGSQGGYMLGDDASKITVGRILRALEGDLSIVEESEEKSRGNSAEEIVINNIWNKLNRCINEVADSITLEDIVQEYKRISENNSYMYYI